MLSSPCMSLALVAFATITGATEENTATTTTLAIRLAEVEQCPVSPKPTCSDDNCQGSISVCATQYLCSSESPFTTSGGRSAILAGCRCCPLPIEVWCHDHSCNAPGESRVCAAEELQGCPCMTGKDRLAAGEAAAGDYVWRSDDSVELDLEPSSDEEAEVTTTTSVRQYTTLATLEPLQLLPLQNIWGIGKVWKR